MTELRRFFSFLLLLHAENGYCQVEDPCTNYKSINNVYRSTKYKLQPGFAAICDNRLTEGWYRFTSIVGGMMPEKKPSPFHCGTFAPIWIRDTHPKRNEQEKLATACISIRNFACLISHKISIKNCGGFYVYKLKRILGCPAAYCAGDKMPCPKGQTGIAPNCTDSIIRIFPSGLVPTPTITYRDNPVAPLTMLCKFQFPNWKNVSFGIEWLVDGKSVKTETICGDKVDPDCAKRYSALPYYGKNIGWYFVPGQRLHCKIRMKYNTNPENKWAVIAKQSNQYYIGIETAAPHESLRLKTKECNGNTRVNVTFTPTVPIVDPNKKHLSIKVLVRRKQQLKATTSAADTCDIKLPHGMLPNESRSVTITPVCDNVNQPTTSMEYNFIIADFSQDFWLRYKLRSVTVIIENSEQKECRASNDPHYDTFDERHYDFMETGDYVLYKNTFTDTEVHSRSWVCGGLSSSVTCNCGIAIREKAEIIIFTICNKELGALPILRPFRRGQPAGADVVQNVDGSKSWYEVLLPSGNRIKIDRYDWGLNVYIKAFSLRPNTTSGLCGNFNGIPNDDFDQGGDNKQHGNDALSFGKSWRVTPSKDIFDSNLTTPTLPPDQTDQTIFCECPQTKDEKWICSESANQFQGFDSRKRRDIPNMFQGNRRRRSVPESYYSDNIMDLEDKSFFVDERESRYAFSRIRTRRNAATVTKYAISDKNATKLCRAIIEDSTAGKTCNEVPGFNVTSAMEECITDLKFTGDLKFAGSAFDTMKEGCEEVALKNVSLYKPDASGQLKPPPEVGDNLCPGDCSGHGNCTNRTCICEKGYTANDCSMDINAVPELLGIYDGGLCDIRKRPCKKTDIFGRNFINSENVTCHVKEFKVVSSNWVPNPNMIKKRGVMIDIFGVRCDLPDPPTKLDDYRSVGTPTGGLLISISNDGEERSQRQMRFVSYDSVCMTCNKTGNCYFKGNSCLIRGHCFAPNDSNPSDWCQQCLPKTDEYSWTRRKVNQPPSFLKGQSPCYAIVGENLPLKLKAKDPDNRPITYSLLSTTAASSQYTFSSTGLLQLNVTTQKIQDFTVRVKDECNATDDLTVTVRIVICPCLNGGKCSPHPYHPRGSGMYSCQCPTGFTGDKCGTNINDCVAVNCGNGTCIDRINNYTCRCNVGFKGSKCDQMIYKCTNQSCFAGVQCTETGSGISCGSCPNGMTGDGKTCKETTTTSYQTTTSVTTKNSPSTTTSATTVHATTETDAPTHETTVEQTTVISSAVTKSTERDTTVKTEEVVTEKSTSFDTEETPTTEHLLQKETKIKAEISLNMEWKNTYQDKQSKDYRLLVARIESEIFEVYRKRNDDGNLKAVGVISLRPGSVFIQFELIFTTPPKDPLLPLKESIKNGELGSLKVDAGSLKIVTVTVKSGVTEKPETTDQEDNKLVIILVSLAIIVVLLIVAAVAVVCWRRKKDHNYRSSADGDLNPKEEIELRDSLIEEKA